MPPEPPRPWKMFIPLIVVLGLAVLWSVYWYVAIGIARTEAASERQKLAARGLTLACASESWGGYPFRFEFTCVSPVLTFKDKAELQTGTLLALALAYNPRQVVVLLDGPTTVLGRSLMPRKFSHQRAIMSITANGMDPDRLTIDAEARMIDSPGFFSAARVMVNTRPGAEEATDFAALVQDLNYQPPDRPAVRLDSGDFLGTFMPSRELAITNVELERQGIRYWGSGAFALDPFRRVSGKLSTETNDLTGLLSLLEPQLALSDQQKAGLRTVLGLLGNNAKADIIAQDGQLFIGPVKVADLLPLY